MTLREAQTLLAEARKAASPQDKLIDLRVRKAREDFKNALNQSVSEQVGKARKRRRYVFDPHRMDMLFAHYYPQHAEALALAIVEICKEVYGTLGDHGAALTEARCMMELRGVANALRSRLPKNAGDPCERGGKAYEVARTRIQELRLEEKLEPGKKRETTEASGSRLWTITVLALGVIAAAVCLLLVHWLPWEWLVKHPNSYAIQALASGALFAAVVGALKPAWRKTLWVAGLLGAILVLFSLLGGPSQPPK